MEYVASLHWKNEDKNGTYFKYDASFKDMPE